MLLNEKCVRGLRYRAPVTPPYSLHVGIERHCGKYSHIHKGLVPKVAIALTLLYSDYVWIICFLKYMNKSESGLMRQYDVDK